MTEQDFPFEAFSEGGSQPADASADVSFINEFSDPVEPVVPDQGEPISTDPPPTEGNPPAAEPNTPPAPSGEPVVDVINKQAYEKIVAEKAEIEAKLAEMTPAQMDENSKKIYDYIREGKLSELKSFLDLQTQDFGSKPQDELLRDFLIAQNPDWSNEDIDDVLLSKYGLGLDEDLMTDQEKRAYDRQLKADAKKALEFFESKKAQITLPDLNPKEEQPAGPTPEEISAQAEAWDNSVVESLKGFDKISIAIKDNEQFDFAVDADSATQLTEYLKTLGRDITVFFKTYINEGKIDSRKLAEDMAFLRNKEAVIRSAITTQVAKAQENWLRNTKNTQLTPQTNAPVVQAKDDIADFIVNNIN